MKKKNATQWIADYIHKQGFSVEQIVRETGIAAEKLQMNTNQDLSIKEFFDVCEHIGIAPEKIRKELGL